MKIIYADDDASLVELNAVVRRYIDLVLLVQQSDLKRMIFPLNADAIVNSNQLLTLDEAARMADSAFKYCTSTCGNVDSFKARYNRLRAYCYRHKDVLLVYFGCGPEDVQNTIGRFAKELGEMVVKGKI